MKASKRQAVQEYPEGQKDSEISNKSPATAE